jgi:hypothetical protein
MPVRGSKATRKKTVNGLTIYKTVMGKLVTKNGNRVYHNRTYNAYSTNPTPRVSGNAKFYGYPVFQAKSGGFYSRNGFKLSKTKINGRNSYYRS